MLLVDKIDLWSDAEGVSQHQERFNAPQRECVMHGTPVRCAIQRATLLYAIVGIVGIIGSVLLVLLKLAPGIGADHQHNAADSTLTLQSASSYQLTRTMSRHEVHRFNYGGTLTVRGAPEGSITIEAWPRSEVEVTAEIELRANTEDDLARLAAVNDILVSKEVNDIQVITTGTHDRRFMQRVSQDIARNFPRRLLAVPWRVDYHIRVPLATNLEIYAGRGAFNLSGVEGAINIQAGESTALLNLVGGAVTATFERGSVNVQIAGRSWRGRGMDIRLATGDLTVELPAGFNAWINANVFHTGHIENSYDASLTLDKQIGRADEQQQQQALPSGRSLRARAGTGGPTLSLGVGNGLLRIKSENSSRQKATS